MVFAEKVLERSTPDGGRRLTAATRREILTSGAYCLAIARWTATSGEIR
jgi:hypothetical protein